MGRILVFGDSIVYGYDDSEGGWWVERLKRDLWENESGWDVYNLWIPGDTSQDVAVRIAPEMSARVDGDAIVIIAVGINDAMRFEGGDERFVGEENFSTAINLIVDDVTWFETPLLLLWLTRVAWGVLPCGDTVVYDNNDIELYDKLLAKIALDRSIDYLPLNDVMDESYLKDGLHPNQLWHKLIYEKVKGFLEEKGWVD